MGRISTAFRAFFRALSDAGAAEQFEHVLLGKTLPAPVSPALPPATPAPSPPPVAKTPVQSAALTLLATLQREARLIDFLQEDLTAYSDEQIGSAVREVQRDSAKVLNRLFDFKPILSEAEGSTIDLPAGFDAGRYRLTGQVSGSGPYRGTVQHHGWEATRCELPSYTGSPAAAQTVAPAEVEVG